MSQSLNKILIHIIFSTKHRQPMIDSKIETELHSYLGGICKQLECPPFEVGGFTDHVHILCGLSKKIIVSDLLKRIKMGSSKWIKTKGSQYSNFYWQDGYAAFSINSRDRHKVIKYMKNQHRHHSKTTYQDECRLLFKENEIEYDERYVWD